MSKTIAPAKGKLGILIVGVNGAVATTFIAGLLAIRKGFGSPFGSLTQMGTIRLGKRSDMNFPPIRDFVPLANIKDIVVGGWDIYDQTIYDAAIECRVLERRHLEPVKDELSALKPMPAVFDTYYVKRLNGTHVKSGKSKMDLADQLRADIRGFRKNNSLDRLIMIWCGSTEIYIEKDGVHETLVSFETGLQENDVNITPSMIYAYASLKEGVPFANGAPNLTVDIPALTELAKNENLPIAGKDFKSGQTMIKTVIAPMLKARMLGLHGWFSTNILGNRDGEVLDDPYSNKTKEESKLSVLGRILQADLYPELYRDYYHKVRINFYPPRGDNKESWDNIDIFGWLGYPMQIKIDFLCRDSILAAPIVLDLVLFLDLAHRAGMKGIQEWLSFYFKSPMHAPSVYPEHDLFIQLSKLKNTLRYMMGEELITHLGLEYYED
jgi:myo-inositol-1-phosphate synthase